MPLKPTTTQTTTGTTTPCPPRRAARTATCLAIAFCLHAVAHGQPADNPPFVARVGPPGNKHSANPVISATGRFVAFESWSDNLVPGDANRTCDVFVCDRSTGTVTRASVDSSGHAGKRISFQPSISGDGRFVAFASDARTLVSNDTNRTTDVFVRDVAGGKTRCVSVSSAGKAGNDASRDASICSQGRRVLFSSAANNLAGDDDNRANDVFCHDLATAKTTCLSRSADGKQANAGSGEPAISADGRFATFQSHATNLVTGDTNAKPDIFLHDISKRTTVCVSKGPDGAQADGDSREPSISSDGRFIAFESWAANLVDGDTNDAVDIFVHDARTGQTQRVSIATTGAQADRDCRHPSISADGRFVSFTAFARNFEPNDTNQHADVYLHDRQTKTTRRVSILTDGTQGNHDCSQARVSADGKWVVYGLKASNILPNDANRAVDIAVWSRTTAELTRITVGYAE